VIPVAAAIVSAIEDALSPFGVRIDRAPVSPAWLLERILAAGPAHARASGDD
jgi:carbon-monoxide dehydrogenase large subunit